MAVSYGTFELPNTIKKDDKTGKPHSGIFSAAPFERGSAHAVGNTMRRFMLTAIEAPAIISVKIEGVPHEYMSIDGVIEDMTNIILNLKGALLRKLPEDTEIGSRQERILQVNLEINQEDLDSNGGQYDVSLEDLVKDSFFEVVNPELHLFTVTKPLKKKIDLRVNFGRGYVPSERHDVRDKISGEILIDASYSPVRLVNYYVENTRVGQDTDFDRLILEVTTDGRVTPEEAVSFAAQISLKHFEVFSKLKSQQISFDEEGLDGEGNQDEIIDKLILRIDEIELSVRSTNCLSGANIETIAELVLIPERRMLEFRNFGKKSLNEIKAKLVEMGLSLGMDLNKYGVTLDNVKEKIRHYSEERRGRKEMLKVEE